MIPVITFILFVAVVTLAASIRIIKEYERGIVYTLGKYTSTRDAGLRLLIPFVQLRIPAIDTYELMLFA